jgi:large subunit ribosomal protein L11
MQAKGKKLLTHLVRMQIIAMKAMPGPPIAPMLAPKGVNVPDFCKQFNEKSKAFGPDYMVRVSIKVYSDRTYDMELKSAPVSFLLKKAAEVKNGAKMPGRESVGSVTLSKIVEIAKTKMAEGAIKSRSLSAAARSVVGTAKSIGLKIKEDIAWNSIEDEVSSSAPIA